MQRVHYLAIGLGVAATLYVLSRTTRGQAAAADVVEFIDVTAERIKTAVISRGYRNNNPGNIRFIEKNPWNGQTGDDGGYGVYATPQAGTRALGKQLLAYAARGLNTVTKIISTWAPSNENNTYAYIMAVADALDVGPDDTISVGDRLPELARAIAKHENGYIDSSYNFDWVYLA